MGYVGTYDRTIFYNPGNKYCIISVKTSDQSVPQQARSAYRHRDNMIRFIAVGYELPQTDKVSMILDGEWENGKHGVQLQVDKCEEIVPQTKEGVYGYLSSRLIKGVGEKTAALIVNRFGADALRVLENEPERLLEIRGITPDKLEDIKASYAESRCVRDLMILLTPFNVTPVTAMKIYEHFGSRSVDILQKNPYELCQVSGFGFKRVDAIVRKGDLPLNSPMRIHGAVFAALDSQADENRVTRYCHSEKQKGFDSLCLFQLDLLRKKQRENELKKQRKIIERMKPVGALPRDIKGFTHRETLPHYIFYDYAKGKAPKNAYCTACKHNISVAEAKHNGEGVCPHCKRKITFKSRGRRGYIVDRSTAQVIQRLGSNEMIIRFVKAYRRYPKSDTPEFHVYENARVLLKWDGSKIVASESYYYDYSGDRITPWHPGDRPVYSQWYYNFEADCCGYLYHRNLDSELKGTPWQYSALKKYYAGDPTPLYAGLYAEQCRAHQADGADGNRQVSLQKAKAICRLLFRAADAVRHRACRQR